MTMRPMTLKRRIARSGEKTMPPPMRGNQAGSQVRARFCYIEGIPMVGRLY